MLQACCVSLGKSSPLSGPQFFQKGSKWKDTPTLLLQRVAGRVTHDHSCGVRALTKGTPSPLLNWRWGSGTELARGSEAECSDSQQRPSRRHRLWTPSPVLHLAGNYCSVTFLPPLVTLSHPATHLTVVVTTFPLLGDELSCTHPQLMSPDAAWRWLPPGPRPTSKKEMGIHLCLKSYPKGGIPFRFLFPVTMYVPCSRWTLVCTVPQALAQGKFSSGGKFSRAGGWRK